MRDCDRFEAEQGLNESENSDLDAVFKQRDQHDLENQLSRFFRSLGVVWGIIESKPPEPSPAISSVIALPEAKQDPRWNLTRDERQTFVSQDGYDLCVICYTKTPYKKTDPIEMRACYFEGHGQLCYKCAQNVY